MHPIHIFEHVVQFEDVDAASIVHHPVYLNYLERARSQSLIQKGCSLKKIIGARLGIVVASVEMKYIKPLELEDRIFIASQVDKFEKSVIHMTQVIAMRPQDLKKDRLSEELRKIESLHFFAHVKLAIVSTDTKKMTTPPDWLIAALS